MIFIELPAFWRRWHDLELSDLELQRLQKSIMVRPRAGVVISGTGGVRKLRFAPAACGKGKRESLRVCYAYIEEVATVVLGVVYGKNERVDLTVNEKKVLKGAIESIKRRLLSRPYRFKTLGDTEEP